MQTHEAATFTQELCVCDCTRVVCPNRAFFSQVQGIEVHFPFEPYSIQKSFVDKLILALREGENALLESPTGTGKVGTPVGRTQ